MVVLHALGEQSLNATLVLSTPRLLTICNMEPAIVQPHVLQLNIKMTHPTTVYFAHPNA